MYIIQLRRFHKLVFMAWSLRGINIEIKLLLNLLCSFYKKLPLSARFPEFYICLESRESAKTNGRHNAYPKDRRCGFFWRLKCYLTLGRHMEEVELRDSQVIKKQKRPLLSLAFLVYNPQSKYLTDKKTDSLFLPGWPSISHVQCINLAKQRH